MDIYLFQVTGEVLAAVMVTLTAVCAGALSSLIAVDVIRERRRRQRRQDQTSPRLRSGAAHAV